MSGRRILIVAAAVLAAGAAAVAMRWDDVAALVGGRGAGRDGLSLYGNVDIRQADLGFRVPGRIARMAVEEGDRVSAGAVLAELDRTPFEDDVRKADAQVAVARADLAKLETGSRPQEIAQAEAQVKLREATLRNAEEVYERRRKLVASGATSVQLRDDARAARDEAVAALAAAKQALALSQAGFREEDIAAGRASLQAAEAAAAAARTSLADATLKAPADGIVLSRVREPGAIAGAGETVYTLSLERPVWIRTYVPEPDLGRVRPGMAAEVATDSGGRRYHGQVGFISPVAEFTPKSVETPELRTSLVYRIRIVVQDADAMLRQGMPVTVRFPAAAGAPR